MKTPSTVIPVVVSSDDGYAMQLAVAIRSLLDTLTASQKICLYILDGGVTPSNKERCQASWSGGGGGLVSVEWIQLNEDAFVGLRVNTRFTIATYYRILCADLLPKNLDRILFTDPDVLFRRNVEEVFAMDLGANPIAAAQDAYCPFVHNRYGMPNYRLAKEYVFDQPAIPGLPRRSAMLSQPYFNAGFLVINLESFRSEEMGQTMLRYCHENRDRLIWADQCALNACLGARWSKMNAAWNVTPPVFNMPNHRVSCYDRETFDRIRSDPAMLHFAGSQKPWHFGCHHPFVDDYLAAIDRTAWHSWRPVHSVLKAPVKRKLSLRYKIKRWLLGGLGAS